MHTADAQQLKLICYLYAYQKHQRLYMHKLMCVYMYLSIYINYNPVYYHGLSERHVYSTHPINIPAVPEYFPALQLLQVRELLAPVEQLSITVGISQKHQKHYQRYLKMCQQYKVYSWQSLMLLQVIATCSKSTYRSYQQQLHQ